MEEIAERVEVGMGMNSKDDGNGGGTIELLWNEQRGGW
jgi:hypothetical protein